MQPIKLPRWELRILKQFAKLQLKIAEDRKKKIAYNKTLMLIKQNLERYGE